MFGVCLVLFLPSSPTPAVGRPGGISLRDRRRGSAKCARRPFRFIVMGTRRRGISRCVSKSNIDYHYLSATGPGDKREARACVCARSGKHYEYVTVDFFFFFFLTALRRRFPIRARCPATPTFPRESNRVVVFFFFFLISVLKYDCFLSKRPHRNPNRRPHGTPSPDKTNFYHEIDFVGDFRWFRTHF